MAKKPDTDAKIVLEKIRGEKHSGGVTAEMLQAVYALEHEKQFEDERGPVEVALRDLITDAVKEAS